jgi:hypothetical protein
MLRFVAYVGLLLPLSAATPLKAAEIATKEKPAGIIKRVQDGFERQSLDIWGARGGYLVGVGVRRS